MSHSSKNDDFVRALQQAKNVYEEFAEAVRRLGVTVATGVFGAMMSVELVNEGPVTILLDSDKTF
jgi:D-tyrosyl-tRNA(Tyr) deacylase